LEDRSETETKRQLDYISQNTKKDLITKSECFI
jgi:hypothetical protein